MENADGHVLVKGDGRAVEGSCIVHGIIFWPDDDADYVDIYDGLDETSGKKVFRIETATSITWAWSFTHGILFDNGVYVDGKDDAVETTILFHNVE